MYKPFKPPLLSRRPNPTPKPTPATPDLVPERAAKRIRLTRPNDEEDLDERNSPSQKSLENIEDSPPKPSDDSSDARFTVLWRKPSPKKNWTWDGDGVLIVSQGTATLLDSDGRQMGRMAWKTPLLPGSTLSMSGKLIEIDARISKEEVRTMLPKKFAAPKPSVPSVATTKTAFSPPQPTNPPARTPLRASQTQIKSTKNDQALRPIGLTNRPTAAFRNPMLNSTVIRQKSDGNTVPLPRHDPKAPGALVMKRPKNAPPGKHIVDVVVDPLISKHLREHQRAGVAFLYECVMGMRPFDGEGAILADEMGLGKTLQTIALIWTLLKQNPIHEDGPVIKKALIVCPVTLINNWRKEFKKWLGNERLGVMVAENNKTRLTDFTMGKSYNIMIIGYEKLRNVQADLQKGVGVDIVIADEGHRLKTAQNKSAAAIKSLNTERRVILSGTPIQNDLSEFYTMVDFVNPGLLNKYSTFKKDFENPILKSRQPGASSKDVEKGQERSEELASITGQFILRRTSEILAKYLPPKTECVVYCRPTAAQKAVYDAIISTGALSTALNNSEASLRMINILKKVCNSPSLLIKNASTDEESTVNTLISGIPKPHLRTPSSAKMQVLDGLLHQLRTTTTEKVVVVSNYTATLDMISKLLSSLDYPFLRLDGSTAASTRQTLVDRFNRAPASTTFVFLLSAKAGGVGLNLIGASRLVLFDIDWNPATDLQAMGRVHRDGQKHPVFIYRLLTKGALEEKIFQRQLTKQGLADAVVDNKSNTSSFSADELRDLFTLDEREGCQTHDLLGCECGGVGKDADVESVTEGEDEEEDLPEYPGFLSSSQIDPEMQERLRLRRSPSKSGKAKLQALMAFKHVDAGVMRRDGGGGGGGGATKSGAKVTSGDGDEGEDGYVDVDDLQDDPVIEDSVLRTLIMEPESRIDFVFTKTSS